MSETIINALQSLAIGCGWFDYHANTGMGDCVRVIIGIDPGVNTGFAVSESGKLLRVECMTAVEAEDCVMQCVILCGEANVFVHVEDARLRAWFGGMDAKQKKYGACVREGVGSVKRDCHRWQEFLSYHDIPHVLIAPKNNKTKMNADQFKAITKWQGRTNGHGRDAAMLVFGK